MASEGDLTKVDLLKEKTFEELVNFIIIKETQKLNDAYLIETDLKDRWNKR